MLRIAALALFVALLAPDRTAIATEPALLLKNAHVVDPERRQERVANVLVRDGKLVSVLDAPPSDFQGEVVDLTGKFLIPGLVDAHVHSWGNRAPVSDPDERFGPEETARRMLCAGVTAFLDLGSERETIFALRKKLRDQRALGADLYAAGPVFIGVGGSRGKDGPLVAQTPADAKQRLDELARDRPDVVKIIFDGSGKRRTMSADVMRALVEHARELGLKTVVHIGTIEDMREAAEAGATAITHLDDTADLPEDVAQRMAAQHVYSIPTMAVQQDFLDILEDHRILDNPLLRAVSSEANLARYRALDPQEYADCPTCRWQREGRRHYSVSLQRLQRAGVPIVAGSDTGNLGTFQGFSLHRELILLHQGGLDTWDALAAGTSRAAALLGLDLGFRAGADASFVVLGASPVADIANTQAIERVLFHGRWVDRAALAVKGER
jgi:imidazolonepropionase-like amidohydrolase